MSLIKDTILIVDNTPSNLGIIFTQLTNAGYKVLVAENGKNALEQASIAQPDLILLGVGTGCGRLHYQTHKNRNRKSPHYHSPYPAKTAKKLQAQNQELQDKNRQLHEALDTVKTLNGLLPICAHCKKIRDDSGYWHQIDVYINEHSDADFSHGICPDCMVELYPEYK